jgi:hypothetical protein
MTKVQVTWTAPEGDSKVCEMGGKTFFDGKSTEIDTDEDAALFETIKHNKQFKPGSDGGQAHEADKPRHERK